MPVATRFKAVLWLLDCRDCGFGLSVGGINVVCDCCLDSGSACSRSLDQRNNELSVNVTGCEHELQQSTLLMRQ
jgi:hypothetical protein